MGYRTLFFCEFTLKFFRTEKGLLRHMERNSERHPPGDEIYRKDNISMFEVDGSKNKMYCQVSCNQLPELNLVDVLTLWRSWPEFVFFGKALPRSQSTCDVFLVSSAIAADLQP